MWEPVMEPGLALLSGRRNHARGLLQHIVHETLHMDPRHVLWCDGDHGFDPYELAERNMESGHSAEEGADRILIKRCMTPFQWDTVLTQHLQEKLGQTPASLVVVAPFDRLYSTDELADWEQEDYVRFVLRRLQNTVRRHRIPMLLAVDMDRWWRTHPILAHMTHQAVPRRWEAAYTQGLPWLMAPDGTRIDPWPRPQRSLTDFGALDPVPLAPLRLNGPTRSPQPWARSR